MSSCFARVNIFMYISQYTSNINHTTDQANSIIVVKKLQVGSLFVSLYNIQDIMRGST